MVLGFDFSGLNIKLDIVEVMIQGILSRQQGSSQAYKYQHMCAPNIYTMCRNACRCVSTSVHEHVLCATHSHTLAVPRRA